MHDGDDQSGAEQRLGGGQPGDAGERADGHGDERADEGRRQRRQRGHEHDQRDVRRSPPGERSGRLASTVAMALPWTSGPDISDPSVVDVVDTSLSRSASVPTTTILFSNVAGGTRPLQHLRVRVGGQGLRRARVADPRAVFVERIDLAVRRHLGGHDREALEAFDLVGRPPDRAVRVDRHQCAADARADVADDIVAPEHVRGALVVDRGGGEHDVVGVVDRVDERVVVVVGGRLGVLEVDRDRARPRRRQPVDQVRLLRARERPALLHLAEGRLVDLHEHDVGRRRDRAADPEARVDGLQLEAAADPDLLHHAHSDGGQRGDGEQRERAARHAADHVLPAGPDADRLARAVLAHEDRPALDLEERPVAAVLDHPLRPGVDRAPVAAARAEVALRVAPQPPLLLLGGRGVRALGLRAGERLDEL